jgi:hypothetical protein
MGARTVSRTAAPSGTPAFIQSAINFLSEEPAAHYPG